MRVFLRGSLLVFSLSLLLPLTACENDKASFNPYDLTAEVQRPPPPERSIVEENVEEISTLSEGDDYTLFTPKALSLGSDGHVYVFDYGSNQVKAFQPSGRYVATYGEGSGRGPGEMVSMTDAGVWRDSLVYVVDARQRRVLFFDRKDGTFVRSDDYKAPVSRFALTDDSTAFAVTMGVGHDPVQITTPEVQTSVPEFVTGDVESILLDGTLRARRSRAVYVPYYLPVIVSYTPDDTTGTAHPTPDYGAVPMPEAQTRDDMPGVFPPDRSVHGSTTLRGDLLTVQRRGTDRLEFDLYDAERLRYRHTVQFPLDPGTAEYDGHRLAVARDTSVVLYRLSPRD